MTLLRFSSLRAATAALCVAALAGALAGCGSRPPAPDWEMNAHAAATKATEAYLSGNTRVADLEWSRARAEVARTGRPELLARLELLRCAAQRAALDLQECTAFEPLRADAAAAERAYADYLAGRIAPGDVALLPSAQRGAVASGGVRSIAGIDDPLSRLVAASVAVQAGQADDAMLALAVDAASERGWRRPLLAWLTLRSQRLQSQGDGTAAAALQRRIELIEKQGAPPARD
ncbi:MULTISPECIES: hypothetical protein [unclassified Acidovorax]|uniref:hypothetical protein n=1 Tax=unclassified Acidovorax TaxID=2684926 RepID=UPI0028832B04|nr:MULTISPECIES: hypothetical protein [unclassified Acidovorax]